MYLDGSTLKTPSETEVAPWDWAGCDGLDSYLQVVGGIKDLTGLIT